MPLNISTTDYITTSVQMERETWFKFRAWCVLRGWKTKYAVSRALQVLMEEFEKAEPGRKTRVKSKK
jgi:hypothetical protein